MYTVTLDRPQIQNPWSQRKSRSWTWLSSSPWLRMGWEWAELRGTLQKKLKQVPQTRTLFWVQGTVNATSYMLERMPGPSQGSNSNLIIRVPEMNHRSWGPEPGEPGEWWVSFNRKDEQRVAWKLSARKALIYSTTLIMFPGHRIFDARDKIASKVDTVLGSKGWDSTDKQVKNMYSACAVGYRICRFRASWRKNLLNKCMAVKGREEGLGNPLMKAL